MANTPGQVEMPRSDSGTTRRSVFRGAAASAITAKTLVGGIVQARTGPKLDPLLAKPAHELVGLIATRQISATKLMAATLDHIELLNPTYNAIVALQDRGVLMIEAAAIDARLAAGEALGPLAGLPWAVKDLQDVIGVRSTIGTLAFKDRVPQTDGIMVERLRKAGAIIIGKTNVPEFGLGSHTVNRVFGATGNAYDPTKSAGGSSGGAAVGLATRMLSLADGSDFGGSLRNPAGWNNVFGFRPGIGLVPQEGAEQWVPNIGVLGPMARNVTDLGLLLSVQSGQDPRSPLSVSVDPAQFRGKLISDVAGKRIGWLGDWGGQVPHDPDLLCICRSALADFEAMGCTVGEASLDIEVEPVWDAVQTLRSWMVGTKLIALVDDPATGDLLGPQALWEAANARGLSGPKVLAASQTRSEFSAKFDRLFNRFDFLVMPSTQIFPFPIGELWPLQINGRSMRTYHEWMTGNLLVSATGLPSLAAPVGFSADGLPAGIQIIGRRHAELECLKIAFAYESCVGERIKRPPETVSLTSFRRSDPPSTNLT